jgi:DUF1680 family protein
LKEIPEKVFLRKLKLLDKMGIISSTIISIVVGGILGGAVDSNYSGRISQFITGPESAAIQLYNPANASTGGWRGEHAGKWLYAASMSYVRTGDKALLARIENVADYLISVQGENGYLGCYTESKRFYVQPSPEAYNVGWDIWNNAYILKGLCKVYSVSGEKKYLDAASRILDLMYDTFIVKGLKIANTGQHDGMASLGTIDAFDDYYAIKPDPKCKALIYRCVEEMDSTPGLGLLKKASAGMDVALIGNGKIYEMLRNLVGLAKASETFGEKDWQKACLNAWQNIVDYHLTPLGGPWGGIGRSNNEAFNRACSFAPYQVTETCEVMEWMHFNKVLLDQTGDARYANELEKTIYNALMAARSKDGIHWIYYFRANGVYWTGDMWSCCWSSGMTAVEDAVNYLYSAKGKTVYANVLSPSKASLTIGNGKTVSIIQKGNYPLDGDVAFKIGTEASFTLAVSKPEWADSYTVKLNGKDADTKVVNGYISVKRHWKKGDRLSLEFPYKTRHIEAVQEYQDNKTFASWYMGNKTHYFCYAKGPLVYISNHADTYDKQSPLVINRSDAEALQIKGDEFTINDAVFKPAYMLPPSSGKRTRTLWIKVD